MKAMKGISLVVGTLVLWPVAVATLALLGQIAHVAAHDHVEARTSR